jgi:FkbM family methyltransferase
VELLGNRWRIDGVTIGLDNPAIETRYKALLLNGSYETQERAMLLKHLQGDLPLIELGGCVGAVSCIANKRLQNPENHVVVEANPRLIPTLTGNRDRNRARFCIVNAAIAYTERAQFAEGTFTSGFVGANGSLSVPARTVESIAAASGFERFDLICDIEGAEKDLIENESALLCSRVRWLLVEMHPSILGAETTALLHDRLVSLGFFRLEEDSGVGSYLQKNATNATMPPGKQSIEGSR